MVFCLVPFLSLSQATTPELYGELATFIEPEVEQNTYHKITLESQLTAYKFIAPEIDFSYHLVGFLKIGLTWSNQLIQITPLILTALLTDLYGELLQKFLLWTRVPV